MFKEPVRRWKQAENVLIEGEDRPLKHVTPPCNIDHKTNPNQGQTLPPKKRTELNNLLIHLKTTSLI